jgi:hypothetical protein
MKPFNRFLFLLTSAQAKISWLLAFLGGFDVRKRILMYVHAKLRGRDQKSAGS